MRFIFFIFSLILVVSEVCYSQNSRLKGVIYDAVSHEEIDSVCVTIISFDSIHKFIELSSRIGVYFFENIKDAKYVVTANKKGYVSTRITGVLVKKIT
ncbi:MAG: hypothetical protein WCK02_05850 [Bacteroidota bacterium]